MKQLVPKKKKKKKTEGTNTKEIVLPLAGDLQSRIILFVVNPTSVI